MEESLYSRRSNLVIGFHGCDKSVVEDVISGKTDLIASTNDYDWLGSGIYFWENNEERAWQWANDLAKRKNSQVRVPAVIGALIDLGYCFDLTDSFYLKELKTSYKVLEELYADSNLPLPQNTTIGSSSDKLIRKLDCAVVQTALKINAKANAHPYDSVKGVFWEGQELYPNAGFREKNHIQICVCNPNCIKGYFLPRGINQDYPNP
ncbi:MAG TPA: hypothetical protein DDW28_03210 [Prevotella sp.]|nr:hypothetical protein [uncultured Prevotella sp.]HBF05133.1 hypothetical protein [Candidatus Segatella violae]